MAGRRERAVWGPGEERVLLELFLEARANPAQRSERGVRGLGWQQLAGELNARCQRQFDKDQVKSKYVRIMQEFELFRSVSGLLGPIRNATEEKAWEKLLAERPKNAQQLRQFRESGFAHADLCQRIADDLATGAPEAAAVAAKRLRVDEQTEDAAAAAALKKPRPIGDGRRERAVWSLAEEKLLLFLYLRAKQSPELRSDKGIKSRGWQNVVDDLNKHSGKEFDKDQCKSKYQRIMQEFELFKSVTGYPATKELADHEWEALFEERPRFAPQLRVLKDRGFAHAETCALITGEVSGSDNQPSNVNEFIASESLHLPSTASSTPTPSTAQTPTHSGSGGPLSSVTLPAPLALAANVLPFLLPASGNPPQSVPQPSRRVAVAEGASNGASEGLAAASLVAAASPFFTQELHDNLNQFLKTATVYMTMQMKHK